jgi:hypothetical protein
MWAIAEVSLNDQAGTGSKTSATIEDISPSGLCVRIRVPLAVGSSLTVKWHRDQFPGIVRNCRSDGAGFLLGIQRDKSPRQSQLAPATATAQSTPQSAPAESYAEEKTNSHVMEAKATTQASAAAPSAPVFEIGAASADVPSVAPAKLADSARVDKPSNVYEPNLRSGAVAKAQSPMEEPLFRLERKAMQSKRFLPKFWRHAQDLGDAPHNANSTEDPVNKPDINPAARTQPQAELLSCEDVYLASGILGGRTKYDIIKIVEMLNSKHIRDLAQEVKRASVLMALEAAGTTADEVLQDAAKRQHALNSYESGLQKQFEEFEAAKTRENAGIKAEIERITAHYAERVQHNLDQVAHEEKTLRDWQKKKEEECQRISEAVTLCGKQPLAEASSPLREPAHTLPAAQAAVAGKL